MNLLARFVNKLRKTFTETSADAGFSRPVLPRIRKAVRCILHSVYDLSIDAGIFLLLKVLVARAVIPSEPCQNSLRLLISEMMRFLPRTPLPYRRSHVCSHMPFDDSASLVWSFALTTILPGLLAAEAGLSSQEMQDFSIWICWKFYKETAELLMKAKNERMKSDENHRTALRLHLRMI